MTRGSRLVFQGTILLNAYGNGASALGKARLQSSREEQLPGDGQALAAMVNEGMWQRAVLYFYCGVIIQLCAFVKAS